MAETAFDTLSTQIQANTAGWQTNYTDSVKNFSSVQRDALAALIMTPFRTPLVNTITGDGAITIINSVVLLTKGSAAAITIAAPSSQDGVRITIIANSDFAHVITFTGSTLLDGTTGANITATLAAFKGSSITVIAAGTKWLVESHNLATIA